MNATNPFDSKNSAQAQLNKSRARLRLAVIAAFGVSLAVVVPMLVQGCKREEAPPAPTIDTNPPPATVDTNLPPATNAAVTLPPINIPTAPNVPPPAPTPAPAPAPTASTGEYTVVAGDSFYSIGKKNGVSIKAISDANPGVDSKKLKIGQKLNLPASTVTPATGAATATAAPEVAGGETYSVKSGDTLTRIAKAHGTTVKALKAENSLTTDKIKVGQKLKIPGAAAAAAPAPEPASAPVIAPIPTLPAPTTPTK